jgi:hypothetical protein
MTSKSRMVIEVTLDDIKAIDREWLTPAQVASVLGCDGQDIRVQARTDPARLGFPVVVVRSRTKIPKRAFIAYMEGGRNVNA